MVRTPRFHCQAQSLVREIKSHKPQGMAKKKKKLQKTKHNWNFREKMAEIKDMSFHLFLWEHQNHNSWKTIDKKSLEPT